MPKVYPDPLLYGAIEVVVQGAGGNESEAARRLGTTRLRINRVRKALGGATPAVRNELWTMLERLQKDDQNRDPSEKRDTKTIQIVRDVPEVALQVLRYMTGIIERDLRADGQRSAH